MDFIVQGVRPSERQLAAPPSAGSESGALTRLSQVLPPKLGQTLHDGEGVRHSAWLSARQ
jgi:hypothetical protein